jgi:L-alanine-DL-glutamate epimerase-like enolase superfamily enzyme
MFAATYGREPSTRGWSEYGVISAMAPVDAALYDIMAKSTGLPLYKFLGAYRDSVPVYVTGGYYREGKGIPELVEEIRGYVGQGFNAIKLKVGGISGGFTVEDDYNRVKAVREAVGPAVRLMLDANNGWDVETTIRASNRMYDLDITSRSRCPGMTTSSRSSRSSRTRASRWLRASTRSRAGARGG